MGTEDLVLKDTKLIRNTKKQRLKIYSRDWILKNTILKNKKQSHKNYKIDLSEVCLKNGVFFLQTNSRL